MIAVTALLVWILGLTVFSRKFLGGVIEDNEENAYPIMGIYMLSVFRWPLLVFAGDRFGFWVA